MSKSKPKTKKRSLIIAIMFMSAAIVVLTALIIGGNAVLSLRSMTKTANQIYEYAMNEGYNTEIKTQVQSTIAVRQNMTNFKPARKRKNRQNMMPRRLSGGCGIATTRVDISGLTIQIIR